MIGIYKISSPSGSVYIGQSWDIKKRWKRYLKGDATKQKYLQHSFDKYGVDNHLMEIISELPIDTTQNILDNHEQYYMDSYRNIGIKLMNIREGGSRGKHHIYSIDKMRIANTGKIASYETRQKLSKIHIGNKHRLGTKQPASAKLFMSKNMKEKKYGFVLSATKIICLNNGKVYECQRDAAKDLNICYKHISDVCKGKRHHIAGFKFKYS